MEKILFGFYNVWKHINYNKFDSIILLVALTIGLSFPMIALNDVNDLLKDGRISKYTDASHVAIVEYFMKYKSKDEIENAFNQGIQEELFDIAGICICKGEIIYHGNNSYSAGIGGINEEYLEISGYELLDGNLFTTAEYEGIGKKVCILEKHSILVRNGVKVGENIEILGETYQVKGIICVPRIYGGVVVPYAMTTDLYSGMNGMMQYQLIAYGEESISPNSIASQLFDFQDEGVLLSQTGEEQEEVYYESIREVNRYRILRTMLVIFFAIFSIGTILAEMIIRERYSLAIHIAMGASYEMVLLEVHIRNTILMIIAFIASIILYPIFSSFIYGSVGYLQVGTMVQISVGGIAIVSILNNIIVRLNFRKREVISLFKR